MCIYPVLFFFKIHDSFSIFNLFSMNRVVQRQYVSMKNSEVGKEGNNYYTLCTISVINTSSFLLGENDSVMKVIEKHTFPKFNMCKPLTN